jgi:HK97 family phage major capsid protein
MGSPATGIAMVGVYQLSQFAMSKQCGACFNSVLTPEQVKEFDSICRSLKDHTEHLPLLKELAGKEGGWAAIKLLPDLLKGETKRVDDLQGTVGKLQKLLGAQRGPSGVKWVGGVPFVTDDCARALSSVMVLETARLGESAMRSLNRDPNMHDRLKSIACEFLGMEVKTAMTTTQIPVPTIYVPQVVELVFAYGQARQVATVFPLGAGTVKLPRLAAGEDDFGYLGVGTAGMSQSITEKRVTAELVTFTANKAGGLIRIPTELEEDTFIQLGQFLARYIARQLAKLEDRTFFLGDGTATYANITGIGKYCATNTDYLLKLAAGSTSPSDVTLDNFRDLRAKVSAAVLSNMAANGQTSAAYYLHPTWEPALSKFNKYPNFVVFKNEAGRPTLDGWPIRWIGVSQAFTNGAAAEGYAAFFGDASYWYLGERGSVRVEVSKEVFFATDELAMRALERIDVQAMAVDAMATLQLGAAA